MIRIRRGIAIDEAALTERFVHARGPGGQNVNKVATAVQLRLDVKRCTALSVEFRRRLARLAGRRLTEDGVLIVEARRFRTRQRNRQDARDKLLRLLRRAATRPKPRRPTQPTPASRQRRLQSKRQRSRTKRLRGPVGPEQE